MKKLLLTLFLLLSAIGWAYAKTVEKSITESFGTAQNKEVPATTGTAYTETAEFTSSATGIKYTLTTYQYANTSGNYYIMLKASSGKISFTLDKKCTSIVITTGVGTSKSSAWTITAGDTSSSLTTGTAQTEFTYTVPETEQKKDQTFTFTPTGAAGKLQSLKFIYEDTEVSPVVFNYNGTTASETVSAKIDETISISSDDAEKLVIVEGEDTENPTTVNRDSNNESDTSIKYDYTVSKETTLTVTPYIGTTAGETSTLVIKIKAADALDNPTFSIAGGAYNLGTEITITSKVGLAYQIGDAKEVNIGSKGSGASATIALTKDYIESGLTVSAYSYDDELNMSETVTQTYTIIRPEAPQFVTESGAIANGSDVIIYAGEDAITIGYQINDGEERFAKFDEDHQVAIKVSKDAADSKGNVRITALAYNEAGAWSKDATATFVPTDVVTYTLVTDVNQIKAGVKFILGYAKSDDKAAAGSFTSSYYNSVKATFTNDNTTLEVLPTDTYNVFTVVKENDKLYIKDSDGKYLKTGISQSESAASEATFEDTTTGIILKLGDNIVCYNSSATRFKTYGSTTTLPGAQIFRSTDDFSAIADAELAVEKVTLDSYNRVELTEGEGWTEKYPAYYTEVNQLTLTYNIESDTDAEATYDVTVTAGDETIDVADAKAGENTVVVPWADIYTVKLNKVIFSDDKGEQELNSEAELTNDITLNEGISATRNGKVLYGTDLIIDWTIDGIEKTDGEPKYAAYVTYSFESSSEDEIGVATEGYTEYGLKGYQAYNGSEFTEANNWSSIAAKKGHLPLHFAGMEVGAVVMGKISVIYPFLYNGNLAKKTTDVTSEDFDNDVNNDDIATGVNSVLMNANGEAEYYNLQGVRVYSPANGLYIRKQGNTVSKVRL